MKKIFNKYLREKTDNEIITFSWYQLGIFDIAGIFVTPMLSLYLVGEQLHWEEIWGHKIIPLNLTAKMIMYSMVILLILYLTLNRKSVLAIGPQQIHFQKRRLTGKRWSFFKNEIALVATKLQSNFYENDTGHYPDIYNFSIVLNNGKKIRLGSFNEEDCNRLKKSLE